MGEQFNLDSNDKKTSRRDFLKMTDVGAGTAVFSNVDGSVSLAKEMLSNPEKRLEKLIEKLKQNIERIDELGKKINVAKKTYLRHESEMNRALELERKIDKQEQRLATLGKNRGALSKATDIFSEDDIQKRLFPIDLKIENKSHLLKQYKKELENFPEDQYSVLLELSLYTEEYPQEITEFEKNISSIVKLIGENAKKDSVVNLLRNSNVYSDILNLFKNQWREFAFLDYFADMSKKNMCATGFTISCFKFSNVLLQNNLLITPEIKHTLGNIFDTQNEIVQNWGSVYRKIDLSFDNAPNQSALEEEYDQKKIAFYESEKVKGIPDGMSEDEFWALKIAEFESRDGFGDGQEYYYAQFHSWQNSDPNVVGFNSLGSKYEHFFYHSAGTSPMCEFINQALQAQNPEIRDSVITFLKENDAINTLFKRATWRTCDAGIENISPGESDLIGVYETLISILKNVPELKNEFHKKRYQLGVLTDAEQAVFQQNGIQNEWGIADWLKINAENNYRFFLTKDGGAKGGRKPYFTKLYQLVRE